MLFRSQVATLWWRDDDARQPTLALDRLLAIARDQAVVPLVAVIPARIDPDLDQRLAGGSVALAQHGYDHANHAWRSDHKAEIGADRPVGVMLGELARGAQAMTRSFGNRWLSVLVPPYNRIAHSLVESLAVAGYVGLSTDAPRKRALPPGLVEVNTHIDIMDWRARRFGGEAAALGRAIRHLEARRLGRCDRDEPTGLLTHHLAHDEDAWAFIASFLGRTRAHRAVRWCHPADVFTPQPRAGIAA